MNSNFYLNSFVLEKSLDLVILQKCVKKSCPEMRCVFINNARINNDVAESNLKVIMNATDETVEYLKKNKNCKINFF